MRRSSWGPQSPAGGRFDFDDGGTYCGGWQEGKAHGHGICTGPKGKGHYAGTWTAGFEEVGAYHWPDSGGTYEGQWSEGKRHGLGAETRGCWVYRGEWTDGLKGRYGVRQSVASGAKYDGTWAAGLQDGYGSETYADGGTFQGQWAKGMRHGYGVRSSAPFGLAAHRRPSVKKASAAEEAEPPLGDSPSLGRSRPEECRGGFVLKDYRDVGTMGRSLTDAKAHTPKAGRTATPSSSAATRAMEEFSGGFGGGGFGSEEEESEDAATEESFVVREGDSVDANVIESYMGEWKSDKRSGFGIAERSDGIKYEGEWFNNKKFGYGLTTYKSGLEEYGKYKNNVLLQSGGKKHFFIIRSGKFKERVQQAVSAAHRASQIALQKADIAISRTATARGKAEQADEVAKQARAEAEIAKMVAMQYAPEFQLPGDDGSSDHRSFHTFSDHHLPFHQHQGGGGSSSTNLNHHPFLRPPEFEDVGGGGFRPEQPPPPPAQSAFLGIFSNNPDRRPSNAGFLRRPSAANFLRRPSTVVEHKLVPSSANTTHVEQRQQLRSPDFIPQDQQRYYPYRQPQPYQQYQPQQQPLNPQQIAFDHFNQYYEPTPETEERQRQAKNRRKRPAIDLTELSRLYGIPLNPPSCMEDEEGAPPLLQRRSTMPTVLDPNLVQPEVEGDGIVRTGSMYTRKAESSVKAGAAAPRKNSLPDISHISEAPLSRETIAMLSSQRREAIRRQEEEAERLRANPLLYLLSPEVWDWFATQQLIILVLVINIALGLLFFKVIL